MKVQPMEMEDIPLIKRDIEKYFRKNLQKSSSQ